MDFLKLSILILQLICAVFGKVIIIPDTKLEDCSNSSDAADIFDFSGLDLIPEDDEHVYVNGTWKFLKEIKKPWRAHLSLEKYDRGQWFIQALDKEYEDFCVSLYSMTAPWYYAFKDKKHCPIPAGTIFFFDYMVIKFPEFMLNTMPKHYMGRWRLVMTGVFNDENGNIKKDCRRIYGDFYEA